MTFPALFTYQTCNDQIVFKIDFDDIIEKPRQSRNFLKIKGSHYTFVKMD